MRSLRVGLVLGNALVEERTFDGRTPITFGHSLDCALSAPIDGVPRKHVLFSRDDAGWQLHPLDGAAVRIAPGARGKLAFGEARVLYQEIDLPAALPRPQLPPEVRGSLLDRVDRRLAAIVGLSLAVHVGIAIESWFADADLAPPLAAHVTPTAFRQDTMEVTLPDEPVATPATPATPDAPGVAAPIPRAHDVRIAHAPTPDTHVADAPPTAEQLREEALRMANLMTGPGTAPHGSPGSMASRSPGADLGAQIEQSKDQHVAIGDPTRSRPDTLPTIGPRTGTIPVDPQHLDTQHHEEQHPLPPIVLGPAQTAVTTTLTPDAVIARIEGLYLAGLKRCYARGMAHDATLAGKVRVQFTVDDTGRVTDATATGVADEIDTCVAAQMQHWTFPIPRDRHGEPTDATFGISLALAK